VLTVPRFAQRDLVLLSNADFILPPDFDLDILTERGAYLLQTFREVF